MRRRVFGVLLLATVAGCADSPPAPQPDRVAQGAATPAEVLGPLVMAQKPEKTLSVREARTRPEGETVVVSGRTPPEKVKPFNAAVAAFVLMDPADLDREEIQEEFDCDDAAT